MNAPAMRIAFNGVREAAEAKLEPIANPFGESVTHVCGITVTHVSGTDTFEAGAPDRIRTCDLCLRRAALYPAELRAPTENVPRPR